MTAPKQEQPAQGSLGLSVAWGYVFGVVLMLFVLLFLLPEAEGPSPWDPVAFRKGILELFANFRILDELADMGIVRVADVGHGIVNVDLDLLTVSHRKFGWAPCAVAVAFVSLSLLLRGLRQRLLASHFGFRHSVKGQVASHFFGRGMNLFFPFGPGDLAIARTLDGGDGTSEAAAAVVFHNRVFELLAILFVLVLGLIYLGWGGALTTVLWTIFLVAASVSLTRPLGRLGRGSAKSGMVAAIWEAFNGGALLRAVGKLLSSPGLLLGLLLLSVLTLTLEIAGYWQIKQAFSSPLDDYVLMKNLAFLPFAVVVAGNAITRIIPYTPASFGVYEMGSVIMFWVYGEGFLSGTTVTLLESLLINSLTLVFFIVSMRVAACPSILETWRMFVRQSARRGPE